MTRSNPLTEAKDAIDNASTDNGNLSKAFEAIVHITGRPYQHSDFGMHALLVALSELNVNTPTSDLKNITKEQRDALTALIIGYAKSIEDPNNRLDFLSKIKDKNILALVLDKHFGYMRSGPTASRLQINELIQFTTVFREDADPHAIVKKLGDYYTKLADDAALYDYLIKRLKTKIDVHFAILFEKRGDENFPTLLNALTALLRLEKKQFFSKKNALLIDYLVEVCINAGELEKIITALSDNYQQLNYKNNSFTDITFSFLTTNQETSLVLIHLLNNIAQTIQQLPTDKKHACAIKFLSGLCTDDTSWQKPFYCLFKRLLTSFTCDRVLLKPLGEFLFLLTNFCQDNSTEYSRLFVNSLFSMQDDFFPGYGKSSYFSFSHLVVMLHVGIKVGEFEQVALLMHMILNLNDSLCNSEQETMFNKLNHYHDPVYARNSEQLAKLLATALMITAKQFYFCSRHANPKKQLEILKSREIFLRHHAEPFADEPKRFFGRLLCAQKKRYDIINDHVGGIAVTQDEIRAFDPTLTIINDPPPPTYKNTPHCGSINADSEAFFVIPTIHSRM